MRRTYAGLAGLFFLGAARFASGACAPSATTLCLNASRFQVTVHWKDSRSRTGDGQAVPITSDTGYFWFFSQANIELVIKVLDARTVNGKFWVFFGALSNVEYDLTVSDAATGASKTYHNPLGQFASVGDTSAFDPSSAVPASHENVIVDGTAAAAALAEVQKFIDRAEPAASDFTPCPETPFGFNLNGCRFHIEVNWDDGRGRTGVGQPVQLTNDTGYFWFFADTNVELMVKVLDARAVNGRFWVFFGALSNVQYTIKVKDSVTGYYKKYVNPSGIFASVGDTGAFRGGYSVAPAPDSADAASADLDESGGSVTATGADGTVFTLELPPQALRSPETVTLTPVTRIDRFPFSGGLVAGVEIEPSGLDLRLPGTLTIQSASLPPPDRTLPYAYSRGGEDFILYPRDPDSPSLRLPLARLGGFGVGQGSADDAETQAGRSPSGPLTPYLQRYAHEVYRYGLGQISRAQLTDSGGQIYRDAAAEFVTPLLNTAGASPAGSDPTPKAAAVTCILQDSEGKDYDPTENLQQILSIVKQKQMLGIVEEDGNVDTGLQEAIELLETCLQRAFDRCVSLNDPFEALGMVEIALQLQAFGVDDPLLTTFIEGSLVERCLRFELDFESKIVEEATRSVGGATVSSVQRLKYRSQHVPLRFSYAGNFYASRSIWEGACSLLPEDAAYYYTVGGFGCTVTVQPHNGSFNAAAAWIGVLDDPTKSAVKLLYDPGDPAVTASAKCPKTDIPDFPITPWASEYDLFHEKEFTFYALYLAKDWDQLRLKTGGSQNGEFFAKKSYERTISYGSGLNLTEETWFFLKHTPDAPMPACQ